MDLGRPLADSFALSDRGSGLGCRLALDPWEEERPWAPAQLVPFLQASTPC